MSLDITISLDDKRLAKAIDDPKLVAGPIQNMLAKIALTVEAKAKEVVPVDTGRLAGSIETTLAPLRATVKAQAFYAPYVEFGTRPHHPPVDALRVWARRHGDISPWALAMAIAKRGTKAQPFMRPGAEEAKRKLGEFVNEAARAIEEHWRKK